MFAIVSHKGNQYHLIPDSGANIDLLGDDAKVEVGQKIIFDQVLMYSDGKKAIVGNPTIKDMTVEAEVVGRTRDEKKTALKFHSKKRYKRNLGHRQSMTAIKVLKFNTKNEK